MTLNVSTQKCKDVTLTQEQLYAIGVILMLVGVPKVTKKNHPDVALRVGALESISGPYFGKTYMTESDWETLIGLETNVTPYTKNKWNNRLAQMVQQRAQDRARKGLDGVFGAAA